ncbi:MAG: hypothetical protein EA402_07130 [Planctomycetota bacterium]|nr:MAG: hypothetical protein EA402_07130 [Planctomycetota bacterium]
MNADICGFMVNGYRYGVPVFSVEEIVRPLPITPVPGSDRRLAGIISLRGVSAAVIDLRLCLADRGEESDHSPSTGTLNYLDISRIMKIGREDHGCRLMLMEDRFHLCQEAAELNIQAFDEPVALLVDSMDRVHRVRSTVRHPPPANLSHDFITAVYELEDGFLSEISVLNILNDLLPAGGGEQS